MRSMNILFITLIWLLLAVGRVSAGEGNDYCFRNIMRDELVGDTISILTSDSQVIGGVKPIYLLPSTLLVRPWSNGGAGGTASISLDRIQTISYSKPSWAKTGFTLLGFAIGSSIVIASGWDMFSNPTEYPLEWVLSGIGLMAMSGGIGAAGGREIGRHFIVNVTLQCP
jgi:hypothetical protein